ncbi:hypothetical protein [Pseudoclavibacter sp. 13-3]|uniref:hypothetical protein n=1 Tax=Pseudoclavibacter sp. 13-3 TaxID=2901228 RepID=UPI001E4E92DA|nr:hypothetical protein [Pseudoclavibacter sp. 13-3]MCD7100503.1 hypothetical protein [Pseudoclavibacter sp. 13-3]
MIVVTERVIAVVPGSAQHQVYAFLRHPHLRSAEALNFDGAPVPQNEHVEMQPDRTGRVRLLLSTGRQTLRETLEQRPLRSAQLFHVALAVLSALHYLAQNGWRCTALDADRLVIDAAGRIQLDAREALRPAGFRQFDESDLALVRGLLATLAADCDERADAPEADAELQALFDTVERGVPLREAFLRSRCLPQARVLPIGDHRSTQAGRTTTLSARSQSHSLKPGRSRRSRRRQREAGQIAELSGESTSKARRQIQTDRARRRGAAARLVGLATLLGRLQTMLGHCDEQLQRGVDWCERRARAVSEDLADQPLLLRLVTPKAMATAVVAVAMLFALFAP